MPKKRKPGRPVGTLKTDAVRRRKRCTVYATDEQRERWNAAAKMAGKSFQQLAVDLLDRCADEWGV